MRTLAYLLLLSLLLVGCNKGSESADNSGGSGGEELTIAFVPKGTTHEFWKAMKAGAEAAAAEDGVKLLWKAPVKEDDRAEQIKVVENFVLQKVDGLVLAPMDQEALRGPVMEAMDQDIPVIIVDSGIKDVEPASYIATDNFEAGKAGGRALAEALGGSGRVLLLRYQEGSASTMEREAGFLAAAEEAGLEVVSKDQYAGATRESAQSASENLLARYKQGDGVDIQGIFTPNESAAFGMMRALQNAQLAGKVKLVGFDSSDELLDAVRKDEIVALVLQDPYRMGYDSVKSMVKVIKKESVEKRIDTGSKLVTSTNIDTDEIKAMLKK